MTQGQTANGGRAPRGLDAARIDAWIAEAQPGARLVYFHGTFAGHGSAAVNEKLLAEEARGTVFLVQDRRTETKYGHDYVAIRSSRPSREAVQPRKPRSLEQEARDFLATARRVGG